MIEGLAEWAIYALCALICVVFATVFEYWHKGWWWIGILVGFFILVCIIIYWQVWGGKLNRDLRRLKERYQLALYQNVMEKPGISHRALLKSVGNYRFDLAPRVRVQSINKMLKKKRIKLERSGRVRRYFTHSVDYDEAIRRNAKDTDAYYSRGIAYKLKGKKAEAMADFEKFMTLTKNPELINMAKQQIDELSR